MLLTIRNRTSGDGWHPYAGGKKTKTKLLFCLTALFHHWWHRVLHHQVISDTLEWCRQPIFANDCHSLGHVPSLRHCCNVNFIFALNSFGMFLETANSNLVNLLKHCYTRTFISCRALLRFHLFCLINSLCLYYIVVKCLSRHTILCTTNTSNDALFRWTKSQHKFWNDMKGQNVLVRYCHDFTNRYTSNWSKTENISIVQEWTVIQYCLEPRIRFPPVLVQIPEFRSIRLV